MWGLQLLSECGGLLCFRKIRLGPSLRDADLPWASSPYDMDQLIQLYDLPGDDDPSSLDQYLFPECSSWGTVAGTDHHHEDEHSYNPEKVP